MFERLFIFKYYNPHEMIYSIFTALVCRKLYLNWRFYMVRGAHGQGKPQRIKGVKTSKGEG